MLFYKPRHIRLDIICIEILLDIEKTTTENTSISLGTNRKTTKSPHTYFYTIIYIQQNEIPTKETSSERIGSLLLHLVLCATRLDGF